jgi:6-phosphofructokinase 1
LEKLLNLKKKRVIKKIGVFTSGGDAPGMNAAIRAVVRTAAFYEREAVGIRHGFQGLIDNDIVPLDSKSVRNILAQGGTILKSARCMDFHSKEGRAKAYENLKNAEVDALVCIGGNGSFTGLTTFYKEFGLPCVGLPGTIDNDLFGTDFTLGYDTATNTVVDCVDNLRDTASSHNRLFFVEVMGRDSGFIALRTAVATGAMGVILPEENATFDELSNSIERANANKKTSNIVIVSEGNKLGTPYEIAAQVRQKFPEMDIKVTILGHLQRGGKPSCYDRVLASKLGVEAVEALLNGKTDIMVGVVENKTVHTFLGQAIQNSAPINHELMRISKILSI